MMIFDKTFCEIILKIRVKEKRMLLKNLYFFDGNDFCYYVFNNLPFEKRPIKIYISYFVKKRENFALLFQKLFMLEI